MRRRRSGAPVPGKITTSRNFCTAKAKPRPADGAARLQPVIGKEIHMEYLVVLATMTMIAVYALIIARCLPKA
jgi:hypothetical protein